TRRRPGPAAGSALVHARLRRSPKRQGVAVKLTSTRTGSADLAADGRRPKEPDTATGLSVVVTSVASDSHTWNLVFLQLTLEELGHRVVNLGACTPDDLIVAECMRVLPDLIVVSSVNGNGFRDGMRLIGRVRECEELATTPVVIGGKLGITGP